MLVICAMVLLCAGAVQADTIDPVIIVRGGTGTIPLFNTNPFPISFANPPSDCTFGTWSVPSTDPTFFANGLAFVSCIFRNRLPNQAPMTSLTFQISPANQFLSLFNQPGTLPNPYFSQAVSNSDFTVATFSLGVIPWESRFEVVLIGFDPSTQITMVPNVPEPGTLALFGTGLLAVASKLRRKKKA